MNGIMDSMRRRGHLVMAALCATSFLGGAAQLRSKATCYNAAPNFCGGINCLNHTTTGTAGQVVVITCAPLKQQSGCPTASNSNYTCTSWTTSGCDNTGPYADYLNCNA
jgi:hypothetical protein